MSQILISGLRLVGHHGVMAQEQRVGNEFEVNIRLDLADAQLAMTDDLLEHTVNYAEIVEIVKMEMSRPSKLLENVAWRIRQSICSRYGEKLRGGMVSVAKLAPPIPAQLASVAFVTEWGEKFEVRSLR